MDKVGGLRIHNGLSALLSNSGHRRFFEDALASRKKIGRIGGMRFFHILLGMSCLLLTVSCSLVTVPVKTVGKVAETTVKTTGSVVEAPFKAVSGGYKNGEPAPAPAPAAGQQ